MTRYKSRLASTSFNKRGTHSYTCGEYKEAEHLVDLADEVGHKMGHLEEIFVVQQFVENMMEIEYGDMARDGGDVDAEDDEGGTIVVG
jgi:hypothetical protein